MYEDCRLVKAQEITFLDNARRSTHGRKGKKQSCPHARITSFCSSTCLVSQQGSTPQKGMVIAGFEQRCHGRTSVLFCAKKSNGTLSSSLNFKIHSNIFNEACQVKSISPNIWTSLISTGSFSNTSMFTKKDS